LSSQHVVSHYVRRYDITMTDKTTNYKPAEWDSCPGYHPDSHKHMHTHTQKTVK